MKVAAQKTRLRGREIEGWKLFAMAMPFVVLVFLFSYVPLFGWSYAFFDYKIGLSLLDCDFVGFKHFARIFRNTREITRVLRNTLIMSGLNLLLTPMPAIFAILLNELRSNKLKRVVQTVTTLPHFISWIIVYSIVFAICCQDGLLDTLLEVLGILVSGSLNPLGNGDIVWIFQALLGLWKGLGWNAIVYIAAIAGIDSALYDAAAVDGANRFQRILYVTVPGLYSTFFVLLLLAISNLLSNGFDQYFVFYNAMVADKIEVLDYYTYKIGMVSNDYPRSIAVGMSKTFISLALLFGANALSKKVRGESII